MRELTRHPEAETEALDATRWYADIRSDLAERFMDDLADTERLIRLRQSRMSRYPGTAARFVKLKVFPFSLIYVLREEAVRVIAVAHDRRRPGYWLDRLAD